MKRFVFYCNCTSDNVISDTARMINYPSLELKQKQPYSSGSESRDKAPDFTGYDQTGKMVDSKKLLEKGPMVLFFYRGKWCPVLQQILK